MQLNIIMKKTVFQKRNHLFVHIAKKTPSTETQRHKQNVFEEIQRQNKENQKRVLRTCNKQVFFFLEKKYKSSRTKNCFLESNKHQIANRKSFETSQENEKNAFLITIWEGEVRAICTTIVCMMKS